jgi:uncharacterized protein YjiS (DUF1127 family)
MSSYRDAHPGARSPENIFGGTGILLSRLQKQISHIQTFWTVHRRREREAQALRALSDRDLWDLGLSRSDLPRVLDGTYRRDGT